MLSCIDFFGGESHLVEQIIDVCDFFFGQPSWTRSARNRIHVGTHGSSGIDLVNNEAAKCPSEQPQCHVRWHHSGNNTRDQQAKVEAMSAQNLAVVVVNARRSSSTGHRVRLQDGQRLYSKKVSGHHATYWDSRSNAQLGWDILFLAWQTCVSRWQ